jgi:hypothetical protein
MRTRGRIGVAAIVLLAALTALGWRYRWHTLDPVPGVHPAPPAAPIMTYDEYGQIEHGQPYILRFRSAEGELLVVGTRHTRSPDDPQIARIRELWAAFAPTVALAEPRLGFFVGGLGPGVKQFGEAGAVFALARRDGVPVYTLEAPLDVEMRAVLAAWAAPRAAAYYVLRASLGRGDSEAVAREAAQLVEKRTRWPGLEGSLDYPRLDSLMRAEFPETDDWRSLPGSVTWPGRSDTFLNQVSTTVNRFRDEHMVAVLASLMARGERVFAVVGSSHAVMQEPALRSLFELVPAAASP